MIHITKTSDGCSTLHLQLEGVLDGAHAVALRDVVNEARNGRIERLVFHCAGLSGAEGEGLDLLLMLKADGAIFKDLPVTIAWRLGLLNTTQSGSFQPS
jgi:hypothetical protein